MKETEGQMIGVDCMPIPGSENPEYYRSSASIAAPYITVNPESDNQPQDNGSANNA